MNIKKNKRFIFSIIGFFILLIFLLITNSSLNNKIIEGNTNSTLSSEITCINSENKYLDCGEDEPYEALSGSCDNTYDVGSDEYKRCVDYGNDSLGVPNSNQLMHDKINTCSNITTKYTNNMQEAQNECDK